MAVADSTQPVAPYRWPLQLAVLGGLLLRAYHYFRGPSVWHDEAAIMVNILDHSYGEMFGPLRHTQAAPPLFLMAERASVDLFGDSAWALRLIPFLSSCAVVLLVAALARRLLSEGAAVVAVALMDLSDSLLWHSCEAKPYSSDAMLAALAAYAVVATRTWPFARRAILLTVLAPLAMGFSFPACFAFGGVMLALFPEVIRTRSHRDRAAYALLLLTVGVSFLGFVLMPAKSQRTAELDGYWADAFADWSHPMQVPFWIVRNTLEVFRFDFKPIGEIMAPYAAIGAIAWLRKSATRPYTYLFAAPVALALVAALAGKYPYSCSRLMAYSSPGLCLLAAAGAQRAVEFFPRWPRGAWVCVWLVLVAPMATVTFFRVAVPWPRAASDEACEFVLRSRAADEPVFANNWESEYYFRKLDPDLLLVDHGLGPSPEASWTEWRHTKPTSKRPKIWVVIQSDPVEEELTLPMPAGYRVTKKDSFLLTRVFQLESDH